MNERIEELVRQATDRQTPLASDMADWQVIEKFAELVIRECARVGYESIDEFQVSISIKEHFGVE